MANNPNSSRCIIKVALDDCNEETIGITNLVRANLKEKINHDEKVCTIYWIELPHHPYHGLKYSFLKNLSTSKMLADVE